MAKMTVLDREIRLRTQADADYISLTDIARYRDEDRSDDLVRNWLRNRNTLEFLGIWEQLSNPDFNSVEFDGFKSDAGLNSFTAGWHPNFTNLDYVPSRRNRHSPPTKLATTCPRTSHPPNGVFRLRE